MGQLSDDAKRMYTRQMEVYAGFLSQTDHHIGRVLDFIDALAELDNTIVIAVSDNGASAEGGEHGTLNEGLFFNLVPETLEDNLAVIDEWGGEDTFNHYSVGLDVGGRHAVPALKRETYRGGVTDPCIVSWPAGIAARGEVRTQYAHAIDIMPTLLEVIGIDAPTTIRGVEQSELHGTSLAYTFADPATPRAPHHPVLRDVRPPVDRPRGLEGGVPVPRAEPGRGRRAGPPVRDVRDRGDPRPARRGRLGALPPRAPTRPSATTSPPSTPTSSTELAELWWARPSATARCRSPAAASPASSPAGRGWAAPGRCTSCSPAVTRVVRGVARVNNRPHSITAHVTIPDGGAEGVLLTHGNRHGGYAFFVADGRLHYVHNYLSLERFTGVGDPAGAVG